MRIFSKGLLTLPQTLGGQGPWPHRSGQGRTLTMQAYRGWSPCWDVLALAPSYGFATLPGRAVRLWRTRPYPDRARPGYGGSPPCRDVLSPAPSAGSGAILERAVRLWRTRPYPGTARPGY